MEEYLADASKRAIIVTSDLMTSLNSQSRGEAFKFTRLQQNIGFHHVGFLMKKTSQFFEAFDRKLVQLVESGLAARTLNEFLDISFSEPGSGPQVLTYEQLRFGFVIWSSCLFVAFIGFLLENISNIIARKNQQRGRIL